MKVPIFLPLFHCGIPPSPPSNDPFRLATGRQRNGTRCARAMDGATICAFQRCKPCPMSSPLPLLFPQSTHGPNLASSGFR
jgi:hypothetical protein